MLAGVAREGSIAGAARALGVTASAVSQQLSALERDAEVALLDRAGNQVSLTAAGYALVVHAVRVGDALAAAAADLDRLRGAVGGPFRIATVSSAAATLVSDAVTALRIDHPELDVTVIDEEPARSLAALARGEVDVAVVDEYDHAPRPLDAGLTATELLAEPLVVVVPQGWVGPDRAARSGRSGRSAGPARQVEGHAVRLADLADEPWVIAPGEAACGEAVRTACRSVGFEPRVRWETDDLLLHLHHVAAGHGVAVLPLLAVRPGVAAVEVHPLAGPALGRRLLAVARTATVPRPAVAEVVEALLVAAAATVATSVPVGAPLAAVALAP